MTPQEHDSAGRESAPRSGAPPRASSRASDGASASGGLRERLGERLAARIWPRPDSAGLRTRIGAGLHRLRRLLSRGGDPPRGRD